MNHTVGGNSLSGHMTLAQASTARSRYNLLYSFNNTSNVTDVFATPGAIVFAPAGRTYWVRFGPAERTGVPDYYAEPEPSDELRGSVPARTAAQPDKGYWESAKAFVGRFLYMVEQSRRSELPTAWASNTDYVMANVADIVGWGQSPGQKLMHLVGIQQQSNALNARARALGLREQRINVFTTVTAEAGEGAAGAKTGGKAVWNATVDTVVSTATLGFYDGPEWAKFGVTQQDWRNGYGIGYGISRVGFELTVSIATGSAAGKVGWVGKAAFAWDQAGNAAAVGRSVYSIKKEGANFGNVVEGLGGLFGLGGNALGALGRASDGAGAGGRGLSGALGTSESIVAAGGRGGGFQAFVSGWGESLGRALDNPTFQAFQRGWQQGKQAYLASRIAAGDTFNAGFASAFVEIVKQTRMQFQQGWAAARGMMKEVGELGTIARRTIADMDAAYFGKPRQSTITRNDRVLNTGPDARGPVLSVGKDLDAPGHVYYGQNFAGQPVPDLHDLLKKRVGEFWKINEGWGGTVGRTNKFGVPASHAEVDVLNQILKAKEDRLGRALTDADLDNIVIFNVWTRPNTALPIGAAKERCDVCVFMTRGVMVYPR